MKRWPASRGSPGITVVKATSVLPSKAPSNDGVGLVAHDLEDLPGTQAEAGRVVGLDPQHQVGEATASSGVRSRVVKPMRGG